MRCRQTNHEGEFIEWCHDAFDRAAGDRQPRRVVALQLGDPRRARALQVPIVEVHLSNVDEREEWRRFSVLQGIPAHRVIGRGPDRLPGGARIPRGAAMNDRVDVLRSLLEEPLLVTNLVNVPTWPGSRARTLRSLSSRTGAAVH